MMDYSRYTAHEFAQDEFFQSWVLHPEAENESFWQNWISEHPHKKEEVEQARHLLLGWQFDEPKVSSDEIAALRNRIMHSLDAPDLSAKRKLVPLWRNTRVAASVALVMMFVASMFMFWILQPEDQWVTYQTNFGEIKTLQLPDGSEVTLNANSSVRYEQDWSEQQNREVWLEGEAFFKVVKLAAGPIDQTQEKTYRKFSVYADDVKVQVLGTQFNVYSRDTRTEIVLEEGVVEVSVDNSTETNTAQSLKMLPGEKVTYQKKQLQQQKVNAEFSTSWKDRRLVFDAVKLSKVARSIEETYGVQVEFATESLAEQIFTGTVPSSDLDILLNALSGIYKLNITRQQDKIIIRQIGN